MSATTFRLSPATKKECWHAAVFDVCNVASKSPCQLRGCWHHHELSIRRIIVCDLRPAFIQT